MAQPSTSIKDYGVTGKKAQVITAQFQKAVDELSQLGGGTLLFPSGDYTTGTIVLKNNVRIYLEANATIYASRDLKDYGNVRGNARDPFAATGQEGVPVLFYCDGQQKVSFEGNGTIDGQAEHYYGDLEEVDNFITEETKNAKESGIEMKRYYAKDPKACLLFFINSKDISIKNINLLHSPNWTLHMQWTDRVIIDGIYLFSSLEKGVNADGIDIDGCRDVRISNSTIITGDDAICLKTTNRNGRYESCEDVVINNCTAVSTSTALKIGTESHGDFKRIVFSNSTVRNTNRGIGIFIRDGANVDGVIFSNLVIECERKHFNWWGDGDPIRFVLLKREKDSRLGSIKNVLVQNVIAKGQGTSLVQGYPGKPLENIIFDNVQLEMNTESLPDKRATHALLIDKVDNVRLSNLFINYGEGVEKKWTHPLALTNINELDASRLIINNYKGSKHSPILLENVKGGHLEHVRSMSKGTVITQKKVKNVSGKALKSNN